MHLLSCCCCSSVCCFSAVTQSLLWRTLTCALADTRPFLVRAGAPTPSTTAQAALNWDSCCSKTLSSLQNDSGSRSAICAALSRSDRLQQCRSNAGEMPPHRLALCRRRTQRELSRTRALQPQEQGRSCATSRCASQQARWHWRSPMLAPKPRLPRAHSLGFCRCACGVPRSSRGARICLELWPARRTHGGSPHCSPWRRDAVSRARRAVRAP